MKAIAFLERSIAMLATVCTIVGIIVTVLIAGHFVLGSIMGIREWSRPVQATQFDRADKAPALAGYMDREGLLREAKVAIESNARFAPYYHWRSKEQGGAYFNVDADGVRRTVRPDVRSDARKVFILGGSAVWGAFVEDRHTIPSSLQARMGSAYRVYNYGELGWVSAQELNYLLEQLAAGNVPDIVIFYDGANDGYGGTMSPAIPRDPHRLRIDFANEHRHSGWAKILLDGYARTNYKHFGDYLARRLGANHERRWGEKVQRELAANVEGVIRVYEAHIRQVNALAREYGFKAFFFWQPHLLNGRRKTDAFEAAFIERMAKSTPAWIDSQRAVDERARRAFSNREKEGVFFLGDVLDEVREPIYIDWVHLGPRGNEIIANEVAQRIAPWL